MLIILNQKLFLTGSHGGRNILGHPHEPRKLQPLGPQQVLFILANITFLGILHVQFSIQEHPHELRQP